VHTSAEHAAAGHSAHSIDLHAVVGPGGGAPLMQVGQGKKKASVLKPRIRASMFTTAPARMCLPYRNGMYGMLLVEPAEGLAKVDREFYVMQGDFLHDRKIRC